MTDHKATPSQIDAPPSSTRRLLVKAAWAAPVVLAVGHLPPRMPAAAAASPLTETSEEPIREVVEEFAEEDRG